MSDARPVTQRLRLRPYPVKLALPFCKLVHRRQPKRQPGMWSVAVLEYGELRGVAIVGRPTARMLDDGFRLEVLRVAVQEGVKHACSMLYGSCSRTARGMGCTDLLTYLHADESGVSLKAAGWVFMGMTKGGEHDRPSRPRAAVVDAEPKQRWFAPWSAMVQERMAA